MPIDTIRPENNEYSLKQQKLLSDISMKFNLEDYGEELFDEVLKLLGEHTKVSRVYIFRDSIDKKTTSNIFEWVSEGVSPQLNNLQDVSYEKDIPTWRRYIYEEKGLICSDVSTLSEDVRNILEPQDIKAIIVLPLYVSGSEYGFIGFDEIKSTRDWSESEVHLLQTIAGLIGNVITKYETEKKLKEKVIELEKLSEIMVGREIDMAKLKEQLKNPDPSN